jgi:lysyl-tRNA synthetase class 2
VAREALGTTKITRDGREIDLTPPWRRVTLRDAIRERTGLDLADRPSREELARAMGGEPDRAEGWGKLVDGVFSKLVEPTLIEPTFVLDYPVELSPFAKRHRFVDGLVERFEPIVAGVEIGNAFTELNDPDEQRRRFEEQRRELERGDEETQPFDEAFLTAMEYGMPPTAGVGLGIDRLVMVLTGGPSVREVVLFPAMRT